MALNAALPNDPAKLHAIIAALTAEVASRDIRTAHIEAERDAAVALAEAAQAKATEDSDEIAALKDEVKRITEILAAFKRHRFGKRSEGLDPDQFDLALEDIQVALGAANAALDAAIDRRDPTAKARRRKNLGHLPDHLDHIERVIDIDDKSCPCCGGDLHVIDEDVSKRLDIVPTQLRILVTRRPRYGCRGCDQAGVIQAPAPDHIVGGGIPTDALLANMRLPSMPITPRCTGSLRYSRGRASTSTLPPSAAGWAGWPGGSSRSTSTFSNGSRDRPSCSPTRR